MSNKFFFFPLFGLIVPLIIAFFVFTFKTYTEVSIPAVGIIIQSTATSTEAVATVLQPEPIIFVGDVLLARHVEFLIKKNGQTYPFLKTKNIFGNTKTIIGNFESAVLENHIATPSFITTFSTNKLYLPLLKEAGFSHVSLANNHALDYGPLTLEYTSKILGANNITNFGHPQKISSSSVTTFLSGGFKVGIIALNEIFSNNNWLDIDTQIQVLNAATNFQVAYVHWGDEYFLKHNQAQEQLAKKLIDAGVDVVVGHHPHVTQDIQVYNDKPIFYSLGNFIFDQYFSIDVQQGLVIELLLSSSSVEYNLIPISSEGTLSQPYKMDQSEATIFLKNLARRSDERFKENIASGKLILPTNLASSAQNSMIGQ